MCLTNGTTLLNILYCSWLNSGLLAAHVSVRYLYCCTLVVVGVRFIIIKS